MCVVAFMQTNIDIHICVSMCFVYIYIFRAELEDYAKRFSDFQASLTETNARFNTYKETMATLNKVYCTSL
jgi:hypothetical protein